MIFSNRLKQNKGTLVTELNIKNKIYNTTNDVSKVEESYEWFDELDDDIQYEIDVSSS